MTAYFSWRLLQRALEGERQSALVHSLGQVECEGDHADCAPDENGWRAFTCAYCGAAV